MQRHYVMYYEMSYGLNIEMHKQAEIVKRLNGICAQVLPYLSQEPATPHRQSGRETPEGALEPRLVPQALPEPGYRGEGRRAGGQGSRGRCGRTPMAVPEHSLWSGERAGLHVAACGSARALGPAPGSPGTPKGLP
ncbi:amino-terminal enhancer of split isoform X2 [Tupaia chinensis]|uniref:amino-terminal enhancer of split isoform X2 n=1 Tax=Tupaia chinensis TaxID=246437 RepID=UPI000FFC00CB|nr:amino-terminal enhancer of split isoform X2 [Tupaia chinensis]